MLKTDINERKWELVSSEYLFRRPWLTARRDVVRLPNGTEIPEFYVLEYPDWVNIIAVTADGEFVMIRQYRHGIDQTRYEPCGRLRRPRRGPSDGSQARAFMRRRDSAAANGARSR